MNNNIKNKHVCFRVNKEKHDRLATVMKEIDTTNKSRTLRHLVDLWFNYKEDY